MELAILFENWKKKRIKHERIKHERMKSASEWKTAGECKTTVECKTCGGLALPSGKIYAVYGICKRCHGYIVKTIEKNNIVNIDVQDIVDSIDVMNTLAVVENEIHAEV